MKVLGISAYYHDSAASLVIDGEIVSAVQEERFTRRKNDPSFPKNAIQYCLKEGGIKLSDIDAVVFYEKPFWKIERVLETYYAFAPRGLTQFLSSIPSFISDQKLFLKDVIKKELRDIDGNYKGEIYFSEHHLSHAASAFYPSPFRSSAILTIDGVGEWATASLGYGDGNKIKIIKELHFPHSVGLLYSAFTYYCGFKVNSGEHKLMGLAPYGNPYSDRVKKFKKLIIENMIDIKDDGSVWLNQEYFDYCTGLKMVNEEKWEELFGFPPRKPEAEITQEYCDLALAIQQVTEEVIFRMAEEVKRLTGSRYLCMAGGVALNCVANGKLLMKRIFDSIWIQPAAGDAGGSLGSALAFYYLAKNNERVIEEAKPDKMKGALLGPSFSRHEILYTLAKYRADFVEVEDEEKLCEKVARLLAEGKIIGWFQGRMEFGPRALGSRSILADPRDPEMQRKLNLKVKFREGFRPFAPAVLAEDAKDFFEFGFSSPYMLLIDYIHPNLRYELPNNYHELPWREKLYFIRSKIPAVTHVDFSARVQTVHKEINPRFWKLLKKFKELTGYGIIINTSFNVRGEPIVCTPDDAYKCFMRTDIDFLVIENFILDKKAQPIHTQNWQTEFPPD